MRLNKDNNVMGKNSAIEAAIRILKNAKGALHVSDITKRMQDDGLWLSEGKTPEKTVSARISADIKSRGDQSIFVRVAPQTFSLREMDAANSERDSTEQDVHATAISQSGHENLTFTDCAQRVLEEIGDKKPLHYREITDIAIKKGWLVTHGKTPESTMSALVNAEIRRHQTRGKRPRFAKHGRGFIGLSRWMGRGLEFQIEQHNMQVRKDLQERVLALKPMEFEKLVADLLVEMGFDNLEVTQLSGDGGIDIRGTLVVGEGFRIKMAVQVKKWQPGSNVRRPIVQQMRGSVGVHERGLIITTSDFSPGAVEEAEPLDKPPIALMNGEQLLTLLMEYGIGVVSRPSVLFEIDKEPLLAGSEQLESGA